MVSFWEKSPAIRNELSSDPAYKNYYYCVVKLNTNPLSKGKPRSPWRTVQNRLRVKMEHLASNIPSLGRWRRSTPMDGQAPWYIENCKWIKRNQRDSNEHQNVHFTYSSAWHVLHVSKKSTWRRFKELGPITGRCDTVGSEFYDKTNEGNVWIDF